MTIYINGIEQGAAGYTDAEALAAAVQAGAITDGVTKAPTHDAVYDVKVTADDAQTAAEVDADVATHAALTTTHGAVSAATASKIVVRDASARAKFAAPAAAGDALIKGTALTITEMAALTTGKIWQGVANRPSEVDMPTGATIVRKTADETVNNSSVLQNDDHLLLAVGINEVWEVILRLILIRVTPSSQYHKIAFTVPTNGSFRWNTCGDIGILASAVTLLLEKTTGTIALESDYSNKVIYIYGLYVGGANAGNLQLQWAQNVAEVADTKVLTNSFLIAHKLA